MEFILFWVFIIAIFFIGSYIEKRHYASIQRREQRLQTPVLLTSHKPSGLTRPVADIQFVSSAVVISADRFKHFLSGIIRIFGGNLSPYESVLDRARREALLRLKEQAAGFDVILNVKLETCLLGKPATSKQATPKASILAYGTAVKYQ